MKHRNCGKMIAVAAVALLAASVVASCAEKTEESHDYVFEELTGAATYRLTGSAKDFQQDSDLVYTDTVSLMMPKALGGCDVTALRDSIIYKALQIKNMPAPEAVKAWLDTMSTAMEYKPEKLSDHYTKDASSYDLVTGYVANLTPQLLVYCISSEGYMAGAAHGMYAREYVNYAFDNGGTILTLDKLFTPEGLKELPARISEQAESMADKIGTTTITDLPCDNNFYISSEGEIVFSYQPYEVASYAQGIIDIPFYPYELVSYMTPYAINFFGLTDLGE